MKLKCPQCGTMFSWSNPASPEAACPDCGHHFSTPMVKDQLEQEHPLSAPSQQFHQNDSTSSAPCQPPAAVVRPYENAPSPPASVEAQTVKPHRGLLILILAIASLIFAFANVQSYTSYYRYDEEFKSKFEDTSQEGQIGPESPDRGKLSPFTRAQFSRQFSNLTFIIIGVVVMFFTGFASKFILAVTALTMANNDLRQMNQGIMDISGKAVTSVGRVLAIIGLILSLMLLLVVIIIVASWLILGKIVDWGSYSMMILP